jgi:hypothetical protein
VDLIASLQESDRIVIDDAPDEYSAFGTACHEAAEHVLRGEVMQFTPEMLAIIEPYVEYVRGVEGVTRVNLSAFGGPHPIWGTSDAQLWSPIILEIVDLKSGFVDVQPERNEQLTLYAAGALGPNPAPAIQHVFLTIVQPRSGGIKTWKTTPAAILEHAREIVAASWDVQPGAMLNPGDHCRFCPAQGHCPALLQHASVVAQMDFAAVPVDTPPSPDLLPIEVAADLLAKVDVLENWFGALRKRVIHELESGREVPGWKMVTKRGHRVWTDEIELRRWAAGAGIAPEELWDISLKSPAQVEHVIGKHLPKELVATVSSGLTLARATDRRPAQAVGPAADFTALPPVTLDADLVAADTTTLPQ